MTLIMFYWLCYLYYPYSSLQTVCPLFWEEVEDWTVHVQTQRCHHWAQYFFPNVAFIECYNDPCFPSSCGECQQTAGEQKRIPPSHRNMKECRLIKPVHVQQTSGCIKETFVKDTHTRDQHMTHILWCIRVLTSVGVLQHTHAHVKTKDIDFLEEHDSLLSDSLCRRCPFIFICVKTSHANCFYTQTHRKSHIFIRKSLKMFAAVDASAF